MKKHIQSILKGAFIAAVAAGGGLAVEADALAADTTVAGYSGKPFDPNDNTCFVPNASWAQNNCATSKWWAIYPETGTFDSGHQSMSIFEYSPSTLVSCRVVVMSTVGVAYSSGAQTPSASGTGFISIGSYSSPITFGVNYAAELACLVPPGGQIRQVSVHDGI